MELFKPYLSLRKNDESYKLEFVVSCKGDQTIESIEQNEIKINNKKYWGVIVTLSNRSQLVNGTENLIFSSVVTIEAKKSIDYSTIKCIIMQTRIDDLLQPTQTEVSNIDFSDC